MARPSNSVTPPRHDDGMTTRPPHLRRPRAALPARRRPTCPSSSASTGAPASAGSRTSPRSAACSPPSHDAGCAGRASCRSERSAGGMIRHADGRRGRGVAALGQPALGARARTASQCLSSGSNGMIASERRRHAVVEVAAGSSPGTAAGEPWTISSSTSSSGIAARAALRSPAFQASHIGCSTLAAAEPVVERGVHRHVEVRGDRELGRRRAPRRRSRSGSTKIRATISLSAPPAASSHHAAPPWCTSSADSQLMIAPSASRPASAASPRAARRRGSAASARGGCRAGSPGPRTCRTSWRPSRRRARRAGSGRRRGPSCTARRTGRRSTARRSRCSTSRCRSRTGRARRRPARRRSGRSTPASGCRPARSPCRGAGAAPTPRPAPAG